MGVDDGGHVDEAGPGRGIGEVGTHHPRRRIAVPEGNRVEAREAGGSLQIGSTPCASR
jgi:hypothetical protein